MYKKQNMLRHMNISNDLLDNLVKRIIDTDMFRKDYHSNLFKEVSRFLCMYTYGNISNQSSLVPNLNFLI
jgi:hypothetical protein